MEPADILWEYQQIMAWEYEQKTGRKAIDDVVIDPNYEEWQESIGVKKPPA